MTQEKVLFRLLLGLLFLGCGQPHAPSQTQPVSQGTPTDPARPPGSMSQNEATASSAPQKALAQNQWRALEPGLDFAEFTSPTPAEYGDSIISVLRVDPSRFALVSVSTSQAKDPTRHTAKGWSQRESLLAAINASMYQTDYLTSVHHLESRGHINNGKAFRERAVLAFDPKEEGLPDAQLIDASCQELKQSASLYHTQIEGIRMLSCRGKNAWKPRRESWSHAAIGEDTQGNILLIHCRSPFVTHDLINILVALPLDLVNLQYAEGGPEAQLYLNAGGVERELIGEFRDGLLPIGSNRIAWPVPNILGVKRR